MRNTRRNQERQNGTELYNEDVYGKLDLDEIAFRFQPPRADKTQLFVFLTPTVEEKRKLLALNKEGVDPGYAEETTISVMKDLVKIPSADKFEKIYNTLRMSKEKEFGKLFKDAMEDKAKK